MRELDKMRQEFVKEHEHMHQKLPVLEDISLYECRLNKQLNKILSILKEFPDKDQWNSVMEMRVFCEEASKRWTLFCRAETLTKTI